VRPQPVLDLPLVDQHDITQHAKAHQLIRLGLVLDQDEHLDLLRLPATDTERRPQQDVGLQLSEAGRDEGVRLHDEMVEVDVPGNLRPAPAQQVGDVARSPEQELQAVAGELADQGQHVGRPGHWFSLLSQSVSPNRSCAYSL
jgi:hypothetical protein